MAFINPRIYLAFQKIFGAPDSQDILIKFLNALLYQDQNKIQSLEIIDPSSAGKVVAMKDSYLDVQATLDSGTKVIIEMQVVHSPSFETRVAYNLAKSYSNQLKKGETYLQLKPVIELVITDFTMFAEGNEVISSFILKEETSSKKYPAETFKLVLVELPKFQKLESELETSGDEWIYFIKMADSLDVIPEKLQKKPVIEKAFSIANRANMTLKELEALEKSELFIAEHQATIEDAKKESKMSLIHKQLVRRFGEIAQEIMHKINSLSIDDLEKLGEDLLDFGNVNDLVNWLSSH